MNVQVKTPNKRKSFANKQNKKDSPKKAKLEDATALPIIPKKQDIVKKSGQKPNKKNKNHDTENGSQKKIQPFPGTLKTQKKGEEKNNTSVQNKDNVEIKGKKKRRDIYASLRDKINSGEKQEAIKLIEDKIKAIEDRGGELSKTAKRKIKLLNGLKNRAEGKEVSQQKDLHSKSESTKRRIRKKNTTKAAAATIAEQKTVKTHLKQGETKTNGNIKKGQNSQVAKNKLLKEAEDEDSSESEDEVSGAEEESDEAESGSDDETGDQEHSDEEEEQEGSDEEESSNDEEASDEEESEEESKPKVSNKKRLKK